MRLCCASFRKVDMAECVLKMKVGYKWWLNPALRIMFYAAAIGIVPSHRFLGWLVSKGSYARMEACDLKKESK